MFKQKKQEYTVKNYNLLKINVIRYFNITILFDNKTNISPTLTFMQQENSIFAMSNLQFISYLKT